MAEPILFTLFSSIAIACALLMVLQREMVYSVGLMILVLISVAGLFLILNAQFLFFVQLIVYAGAVMVFFVFTAMMIRVQDLPSLSLTQPHFWIGLGIVSLLLFQFGMYVRNIPVPTGLPGEFGIELEDGSILRFIGKELFTNHIVALQGLSVLLLVALVGAVYISRDPTSSRGDDSTGTNQIEDSIERTSS